MTLKSSKKNLNMQYFKRQKKEDFIIVNTIRTIGILLSSNCSIYKNQKVLFISIPFNKVLERKKTISKITLLICQVEHFNQIF